MLDVNFQLLVCCQADIFKSQTTLLTSLLERSFSLPIVEGGKQNEQRPYAFLFCSFAFFGAFVNPSYSVLRKDLSTTC